MRRRSHVSIALAVLASAAGLGLVFVGCDAGGGAGSSQLQPDDGPSGNGGDGEGGGEGGGNGQGGSDGPVSVGVTVGNGGAAASTGTGVINPCGTECGPVELCDGPNRGIDNDCDGQVDEDCPCNIGQASDCFKGDPSYRDSDGCFPGTMQCTEFSSWGTCEGGAHAFGDEPCQEGSLEGCHPITAVPFAITDLMTGTGVFSQGADEHIFEVACPMGVNPCPEVQNGSQYQALQSGEYTVTYTKMVDGDAETCTFPLSVGAPGLRVELEWNHEGSGDADYDLHVLQPGTSAAFSGGLHDCYFANCTYGNAASGNAPNWFIDDPNAPEGTPVRWYDAGDPTQNTCYYSPRGVGQQWRNLNRGCHNPRLDLDNISCNPGASDPNDGDFCAPENINIDVPPKNQWMRIGVHYYPGTSSNGYPVRPNLKIFCNGSLGGALGTTGFYDPERPIEQTLSASGTYWIAADVIFLEEDECGSTECVVRPIYQDEATRTPMLGVGAQFGPPYGEIPQPGE
jgi:hypothetical protein